MTPTTHIAPVPPTQVLRPPQSNNLGIRCGEGQWHLKSKAVRSKTIAEVAASHGQGGAVLILSDADVDSQPSAASLDEIFGNSDDDFE